MRPALPLQPQHMRLQQLLTVGVELSSAGEKTSDARKQAIADAEFYAVWHQWAVNCFDLEMFSSCGYANLKKGD